MSEAIKIPPKTTKPIHPVYGKALGYRCPVCKIKGYKVAPSALYGGSMCRWCSGGVIRNKQKWMQAAKWAKSENK